MINDKLKEYIENCIFPEYDKNDSGHGIEHIKYVVDRSFRFAKCVDNINLDMVYVVAAYHDIAHHIDAKNHEMLSAEILENDIKLRDFFSNDEIRIMCEAVYDHRASGSGEPRSIYGKIVSSADRNTNVDDILKRTYAYRIKHSPESSLDEVIEESRKHIEEKFGKNGYASEKMYFRDEEYIIFLKNIDTLVKDRNLFNEKYLEVNSIVK